MSAFAGQVHPDPIDCTVPITMRFTPKGVLTEKSRTTSSTLNERRKTPEYPVSVLDSISVLFSDRGVILRASSVERPSVKARFGEGSASMAIVFNPLLTKETAKAPAIRVFPTPPLPATETFSYKPPFSGHA
jgi:hypothetical protein